MAAPLQIKSDALRPLAALANIAQGGSAYYRQLRNSPDRFIATGAWCTILDENFTAVSDWNDILTLCDRPAIRKRAFAYFEGKRDADYARRAAETQVSGEDYSRQLMLAELEHRPLDAAEAEGELYLQTADLDYLKHAATHAEEAQGWRGGLPWALRAFCIAPLNPTSPQLLYAMLEGGNQYGLLREAADILINRNIHLQQAVIYQAAVALSEGNAELCLSKLKPLDDAKIKASPALKSTLGVVQTLRAQAQEKLGHYQRAYEAYSEANATERDGAADPRNLYRGVEMRRNLVIPPLPPEVHAEVVQMLGFPRSGTTLLENVLNAHPRVETFEEIPSLNAAIARIEQAVTLKMRDEPPEQTYLEARKRYYQTVQSYRRKPEADKLVDKLPIRTVDANFIARLFPEWRYVFSIRHPYDVVLSCFKQRFNPNPAMENFRTIADAVRLYDFTMTEWFKLHTMDDPNVHYLRYDDLVTNFEPAVSAALEFIGVPWDDAVQDFAAAAENRSIRTPSHTKVRQGLSIGVQTQWRNYGFVFQSDVAKPLRKWVELFGYELE